MSDSRGDDRAWVEAVERYLATAGTRKRRRSSSRPSRQGRYVLASAVVLALLVSPFAVGKSGDVIREGKRNPSSGSAKRETEIISSTKTYSNRLSNIRNGNGGGAIYGCRSSGGREPCVRANNLNDGRAFEFETNGSEAGHIEVKGAGGRPLTTNATGVATGFNADRVDSLDLAKIDFRAPSGTATTDVLNLAGLILRATCGAGPALDVTVDTTVLNSSVHVAWNKDPGNVPFYRQDNDLDPGDNFSLLAGNDDSAQGTIAYATPEGVTATVTFQSEEGGAFAGTTNCLFSGTAVGG